MATPQIAQYIIRQHIRLAGVIAALQLSVNPAHPFVIALVIRSRSIKALANINQASDFRHVKQTPTLAAPLESPKRFMPLGIKAVAMRFDRSSLIVIIKGQCSLTLDC